MDFIYFFISYPRKETENPEDIDFIVPDNDKEKPECIYTFDDFENGTHNYRKIFKTINKSKNSKKKETKYYFELEIDDTTYIISFNAPKDVFFIYDVNLLWGKTDINIRRKIDQSKVGYIQKLHYFKEAIKDPEVIKELYNETIDLFFQKKGFYFLVELFLEIYKEKDLCPKLMNGFRKMNKNPKDNEKNMERKPYLFNKEYVDKFSSIFSEAESIIKNNDYEKRNQNLKILTKAKREIL